MASVDSDGSSRPKTSSTVTTLSPRTKDAAALKYMLVNTSDNVHTGTKKRLAVKPQTLRPQTSPDAATFKSQVVTNRIQSRSRTSKRNTGNDKTNCSTETLLQKREEKPKVVLEDREENSTATDILFVSASRSGFSETSDVAQPGSSVVQDLRGLENKNRTLCAEKQLKDSSPPSRNNRYGNGIKTRLAKLFNKGNTCMEEPKVVEPQRIQDRTQVPYLAPTLNGLHGHTRFENVLLTCHKILIISPSKNEPSDNKPSQIYAQGMNIKVSRFRVLSVASF